MEKDRNKKIEKTKANILEALLLLLQHKEINEISIRELTDTIFWRKSRKICAGK